jgi:superfamily II DNA or RNA helicase
MRDTAKPLIGQVVAFAQHLAVDDDLGIAVGQPAQDCVAFGLGRAAVEMLGFDACLVLARPTKQQGLYRQMVGRGLRPAPGKTSLVVLDHAGAIYRHGCVEDSIEWTLEPDKRVANPVHTGRRVRDTDGSYQSRFVDCNACGAKRMSGEACVHCGYYPTRAAEAIAFQDGDLSLYDRRTNFSLNLWAAHPRL